MSENHHKNNVTPLPKPKKERHSHKGGDYIIMYDPDSGKWTWHISVTHTLNLSGESKSRQAAVRAAKRKIDEAT